MQFEFEYPYYFLLLLPIACIYVCPPKKVRRYFVHLSLFSPGRGFFDKEKLLVAIAAALMVTALSAPCFYEQKSPNKRKGRDLVIVLDSSGSMSQSGYDTEDTQKSKFDAVRMIMGDFISRRGDDNIGVVVFGTFAFAAAPLTYDMHALRFVLRYIEPSIAGENTAIGDGLHEALRVLENGNAREKVLILLSDGYQNTGSFSIKSAVEQAKKKHIRIYTVGIGAAKDYDEKLLRKIAKETGGRFFQAADAKALQAVYEAIDDLEPSPIRSHVYVNKTVMFDVVLSLAIAIIFFLLRRQKTRSAV